ncbi:hypothetical protein CON65_14150 [Bacillus pseudomycoides]|uniref:Uncharacterized protein n=1 Tax=Bacillus pseudomycoides TaxID=64104 RepID=A0AA91VBN1_9BACI|nr:hypothetical protein COO03_16380 [Bacillus sp. AFS098217]PED82026.1 hypothetical protein CON65_14150 [Bacillus pseudomycoides]PEU16900.1 hypothetical protein CN524_03245 [Bacillus sp. AFS019443]PEU20275.1 hypothetical protein CN525_04665 [Bacillus sp. AFS014408]PFW61377.1 hypothetical protein COL20_17715 [Bacillus sp. AFS075034]
MRKFHILLFICLLIGSFCLYILSLLKTFPLLISLPLLFGAIILIISYLNHYKRFKGF